MKLNKLSRWIIVATVLALLSVLLLTQVDAVRATIGGAHMFKVFVRVETEIMQKTPAGQYYESLFWKHNDEVMQIMSAHPEHTEELLSATLMFVPELEALLDGNGDKVYVTSDHVKSLKAELDWFASMGSSALREDIQREQQRLSLDDLVGMTMNDALDFINSGWNPESVITKTLVPDSDGKWAYYVHNGVYLEYPSSYYLQVSETEKDYVYFIPSADVPDEWNPWVMKAHIWNVPVTEKDTASSLSWYAPESIVWQGVIQTPEFQGVEFVSHGSNAPTMDFHTYQYNEENQLAVDIWVFAFENPQLDEPIDYSEMIDQKYKYFQHMVDSIQIRNLSAQQTGLVVEQTLVPGPELSRVTYLPEAQTLVPDSDGKWAYYVCKGIYLEYPATHYFEISESDAGCFIQFMPFTSEPLQWNPRSIMVYVSEIPATRKDLLNPSAFYPAGSVPWEAVIQNGEFEGVEYMVNPSNEPGMDIHALQYNQKNQLIVGIQIQINEDLQVSDHSEYFALINERYEDFQHMVNSLRIQTP